MLVLAAGEYRLSRPVRVTASGIVLRGEGNGPGGTVLRGVGPFPAIGGSGGDVAAGGAPAVLTDSALTAGGLIEFIGTGGPGPELAAAGPAAPIAADCVVGTKEVRVAVDSGFAAGSLVLVRRFGNRDWLDVLKLPHLPAPHLHAAERRVLAVRRCVPRLNTSAPASCCHLLTIILSHICVLDRAATGRQRC